MASFADLFLLLCFCSSLPSFAFQAFVLFHNDLEYLEYCEQFEETYSYTPSKLSTLMSGRHLRTKHHEVLSPCVLYLVSECYVPHLRAGLRYGNVTSLNSLGALLAPKANTYMGSKNHRYVIGSISNCQGDGRASLADFIDKPTLL